MLLNNHLELSTDSLLVNMVIDIPEMEALGIFNFAWLCLPVKKEVSPPRKYFHIEIIYLDLNLENL